MSLADIDARRAAVLAEARSWIGTPYHHKGRVKGAGVDCATILLEVYARAGVIPEIDVGHYPMDWHMHRDEERYLNFVGRFAVEITHPPLPGDVVVWRFGRVFSHGAIVMAWPRVLHAYLGQRVREDDAAKAAWLSHIGERGQGHGKPRPRKFFTPKAWAQA
jgi:cell wall-associated NlpC family hydrolase